MLQALAAVKAIGAEADPTLFNQTVSGPLAVARLDWLLSGLKDLCVRYFTAAEQVLRLNSFRLKILNLWMIILYFNSILFLIRFDNSGSACDIL